MGEFPVCAIRSATLSTPDIDAAVAFYTDVWGLSEVPAQGPGRYLRATGADHHVLALLPGPAPKLLATTFRAASAEALEAIAAGAAAAGCTLLSPPGPASDDPAGGRALALRTLEGATLRVVHGDRLHPDAGERRDLPSRLSHVNLNTRDVDALAATFSAALGMALTDRSKMMAFLRCNADHHAVVVAEAPVEGLNHLAFMMPGWEDVMRASGRMIDHGHPIGWGVGRHGPGDNVFAYFVGPDGVVIEYTAEVLQVDGDYRVGSPADWRWPPGRTDQWGIAPPKSAATRDAQLAIPHA